MRYLAKFPGYKLVIWMCFIPSIIYIPIYEFLLIDFSFSLFGILSKLAYSMAAASIFYFVVQYIGVYIPKEQRKRKILPHVFQNALRIDNIVRELRMNLNCERDDITDFDKFESALKNIDTNKPVGNFNNWHEYLAYFKSQLLELIRSSTFHHELLSQEYLQELLIIEHWLMYPNAFAGHKVLAISNLSFATKFIQEIIVHSQNLLDVRQVEFEKYKKSFDRDGKKYREQYYTEKI